MNRSINVWLWFGYNVLAKPNAEEAAIPLSEILPDTNNRPGSIACRFRNTCDYQSPAHCD